MQNLPQSDEFPMEKAHKDGYVVNCSSAFRDKIIALAARKLVNPGDLARSIILSLEPNIIDEFPDPGDAFETDREAVTLKSGPHRGKVWRRKPRLQMRLPRGPDMTSYDMMFLRKALALALALEEKQATLCLVSRAQNGLTEPKVPSAEEHNGIAEQNSSEEPLASREKVKELIEILSFQPLASGCRQTEDAFYILGLPRKPAPTPDMIRHRYRLLAGVFHPDSPTGDHERMALVNRAMGLLKEMKIA